MYYLVTLNKNQVLDYVDYKYLDQIVKSLDKPFFSIKDYCLEYHGKYKQLHAHMIVKVDKHFRYKPYVKAVTDFNMHFKRITTPIIQVSNYIHKHCSHHGAERLQQIQFINYYRNHYGF